MKIEMGARLPLLLHPRCPPTDDRDIAGFLELFASVTSAAWVELVLTERESGQHQTYVHGTPRGKGSSQTLDAGKTFSARLRSDGAPKPPAALLQTLSAALSATLERHRLHTQIAVLGAALDSTSSSVFLFERRGDIVYANPPADRLLSLQTEDELMVEAEGEPGQPLFALLSSLVDRVVSPDAECPAWRGTLQAADGRVLACEVTCLPPLGDLPDTVLVLLQQFGSEPAARVEGFCASHGLSPREQEVVRLLVEGLTTVAMADRLGISPHTVRDHLKNLYRKTGASSRSELLGLVSRATPPKVATSP